MSILLCSVAVLTLLSGLSMLVGASKSDRKKMIWFFATACGAVIWTISIVIFLQLPTTAEAWVKPVLFGVYVGGALFTLMLLGFSSWPTVYGKILFVLYAIYIVAMSTTVWHDPSGFFAGHILSSAGNSVQLVNGWQYWVYMGSFALVSGVVWLSILQMVRKTRTKRVKQGYIVLLVALMFTGMLAGLFDMILPLFVRYDLIWVGPLAISVSMILFYYALLKFRIVSIASNWLKILSSVTLTGVGIISYMLIFYLIFTALFKIPNPSPAIMALNFLMIVIVLLLMPVLNELKSQITSLISVGQVDLAYVVKKLNRLATKNVDLRELAAFLADHLHFSYAGFILNGRLYGSKTLTVTPAQLAQITHMKASGSDIWQEPNKTTQQTLDELGIKAVAELRNAKGRPFGQLVVGKPMGKTSFDRRDLIQVEMVINLVATIIDSEKHLRA